MFVLYVLCFFLFRGELLCFVLVVFTSCWLFFLFFPVSFTFAFQVLSPKCFTLPRSAQLKQLGCRAWAGWVHNIMWSDPVEEDQEDSSEEEEGGRRVVPVVFCENGQWQHFVGPLFFNVFFCLLGFIEKSMGLSGCSPFVVVQVIFIVFFLLVDVWLLEGSFAGSKKRCFQTFELFSQGKLESFKGLKRP